MKRIVLLGGSGYVGQAFQEVLTKRGISYHNFSRKDLNYYDRGLLRDALRGIRPDALINAAGFTGKPNVDACEEAKADCLLGNAVLPGIVREVCQDLHLPWGHVSSGCIYTGKSGDGRPFQEDDRPNFSFRSNFCSFYSGAKALGEEVLNGAEKCYVWRLRIPFDHRNHQRNYLSKLLAYERLLNVENSISQRFEFVGACLDCLEMGIPFGTYNVTNPGSINARTITDIMKRHGLVRKELKFFESEEAFNKIIGGAPRSNCILCTEKLSNAGIRMTEVHRAIEAACRNWIA